MTFSRPKTFKSSPKWTNVREIQEKPDKRRPLRQQGTSKRSLERRAWARELKTWFATLGIESCEVRFEGCMRTFGGALAHSLKRRFINTREQYFEVCYACQFCHDILDNKMSHADMETKVKEIIEKRNGIH
jgi:hypothetical protein